MNNAVIYARYSSDHQNPISIDKQIERCWDHWNGW